MNSHSWDVAHHSNSVYYCLFGGFHGHGGTPIAGGLSMENPIVRMDDDWGYPYFRKPLSHFELQLQQKESIEQLVGFK